MEPPPPDVQQIGAHEVFARGSVCLLFGFLIVRWHKKRYHEPFSISIGSRGGPKHMGAKFEFNLIYYTFLIRQ